MNANEVIIPCRLSYANIWEPKQVNGTGDPKYSCCLLIKKSDTAAIAKLKAAIEAVKKDPKALARWGGSVPKNLKLPLRDGDAERPDDEVYAGHYFVNANCKQQPGLVYKNGQKIIDSTDLYSGCYGHASINFFAFNNNGNKGIACGLNHLMKTRDGEPLGGRSKAEDDFAGLIEDSDDFLQ